VQAEAERASRAGVLAACPVPAPRAGAGSLAGGGACLTPPSCRAPCRALERIPQSVRLWKAAVEISEEDDARVLLVGARGGEAGRGGSRCTAAREEWARALLFSPGV
jgi:hypothetical protein